MRRLIGLFALSIAVLSWRIESFGADAPPEKPRIDIVFCIDCSTSMGPVIETAKQKVWTIVNQIARAKPAPELRIGLLAYGDFGRTFHQFALSNDLDEVYKNLLTIREEQWHDEYVGLAIHKATTEMKWSEGKQVYKAIYVVGNETAHQGPDEFDYTKTAPAAIARGIIVNAIYCGEIDYATATPTWKEFARLSDGAYLEIAARGGAVVVATPFDKELGELSVKLNSTYVGYGREYRTRAAAQSAADSSTAGFGAGAAAERANAKASEQYNNSTWDLVDRRKNDKDFDLKTLKEEELPEELRKIKPEERALYIDQKCKEREQIATQIKDLSAKRDAYIQGEIQKQGLDTNKAFDQAVLRSVTEQASKRGFEFEKDKQK